jgi:hypothetical protein
VKVGRSSNRVLKLITAKPLLVRFRIFKATIGLIRSSGADHSTTVKEK